MTAVRKNDRHIQSITVGFRLVQSVIRAGRALSLKELSEESGLQTGHAFLYMASFLKVGLVKQDPATSRYDLGPLAFDLGLAAIRRADVVELAKEEMRALEAQTTQSVFLSVWGNRGPTCVSKVDASPNSALQLTVGFVLPLIETATGRLFLAHLPRAQTHGLVAAEMSAGPRLWDEKLTQETVDAVVAKALANGYSTSDPRRNDGYASIAAPIFDHASAIRASITLIGSSGAFKQHAVGYRNAVLDAAAGISEKLGYRQRKPTLETV